MPPIKRQKLRKPTKRFDMTALREALADGRVHASLALVVLEGSSHFEVTEGADVLVDVELQPSGVRTSARLGGVGIYAIPPVGAEVIVLVPDGELEAGAVLVARTGEAPDGLAADTLVVVAPAGGTVLVHDGTAAEAVALATKADVQGLRDYVNQQFDAASGHKHSVSGAVTVAITTIAVTPTATPNIPVPQPAGTSVLRAK